MHAIKVSCHRSLVGLPIDLSSPNVHGQGSLVRLWLRRALKSGVFSASTKDGNGVRVGPPVPSPDLGWKDSQRVFFSGTDPTLYSDTGGTPSVTRLTSRSVSPAVSGLSRPRTARPYPVHLPFLSPIL